MFDTKANCPHCGAPIESMRCPYCGTLFLDFVNMDVDEPTYLRVKAPSGQLLLFKAAVGSMTFTQEPDCFPVFTAEFIIMPEKDAYMEILGNESDAQKKHGL